MKVHIRIIPEYIQTAKAELAKERGKLTPQRLKTFKTNLSTPVPVSQDPSASTPVLVPRTSTPVPVPVPQYQHPSTSTPIPVPQYSTSTPVPVPQYQYPSTSTPAPVPQYQHPSTSTQVPVPQYQYLSTSTPISVPLYQHPSTSTPVPRTITPVSVTQCQYPSTSTPAPVPQHLRHYRYVLWSTYHSVPKYNHVCILIFNPDNLYILEHSGIQQYATPPRKLLLSAGLKFLFLFLCGAGRVLCHFQYRKKVFSYASCNFHMLRAMRSIHSH